MVNATKLFIRIVNSPTGADTLMPINNGVTSFQVCPSAELQTSRGGAEKESNHPPRIQSRSLKTASPLESRGRQPAKKLLRR
jgi:hypothetical protein